MSEKSTTRHLVLTVTAHVVDVFDSGTPQNPLDKMVNQPALWIETRPCPPCVGIPLLEVDENQGPVNDCLVHVRSELEDMLTYAAAQIMEQARAWQS